MRGETDRRKARPWLARAMLSIGGGGLSGCVRTGPHSMLDPAGPQAEHIDRLWWLLLGGCSTVFVLVILVLILALRHRPEAPARESVTVETARRLGRIIGGAVVVTAIVLLVFLTASVATDRRLAVLETPDALTISIVGRQWWWEVRYEDENTALTVTTANEIHIPVGQPVQLRLTTADVIHSFWVPSLHGKRDLIPGRVNTLWIQADREGVFEGQCAEFCGHQHAHMRLLVVAQPAEEFASWLAHQHAAAREPDNPAQVRGREVFLTGTCIMCHTVRGTTAMSRAGPDLTHFASRRTLGAGLLPNTRGNLAGWILDSQGLKPGNHMPPHVFSSADLHALLDYLLSLE